MQWSWRGLAVMPSPRAGTAVHGASVPLLPIIVTVAAIGDTLMNTIYDQEQAYSSREYRDGSARTSAPSSSVPATGFSGLPERPLGRGHHILGR